VTCDGPLSVNPFPPRVKSTLPGESDLRYTARVPTEPALSVTLAESKIKGCPTALCRRADGHEFYLHSPVDPQAEARSLVWDLPRRARTLYVVLGFGLGYHVKEMLQRVPASSHVLVIEPESACLSASLRAHKGSQTWAWTRNRRLEFLAFHDPRIGPMALVDRMTRLRLLAIELRTHLPSTQTSEDFYRALFAEIQDNFQSNFQNRLASLDKIMENHLPNFWANLPYSWRAAPVEALKDRWSGRPLIIASAGPSLTEALPILENSKGNALLVATAPTVRLLLSRGIRPDLAISFDPYRDNLAHFQGWDTSRVPLVYYHQTHRDVVRAYAGPRFCFRMQDDPLLPLTNAGGISPFRPGGSVAFSALQLAHYLNADPVIFAGQDFAFPGNHTHAPGAGDDVRLDVGALPADYFRVPGVDGNQVITNRLYYSYLLYMQDYLLDCASRNPGVRHINTSPAGALFQGAESMTLDRALSSFRGAGEAIPREIIESALLPSQASPRKRRKDAVSKWVTEIDRLVDSAAQMQTMELVASRFKATSLYTQAARMYDDIFYLNEVRAQAGREGQKAEFLARFKRHLEFLAEELRRIEETESHE
jgi:hypothetical protein